MRNLILVCLILCSTIVNTGCGSMVSVNAYSANAVYSRDCMGPNAMYRSTDRECQHKNEPIAQGYAVEKVDVYRTWSNDTAVLVWCRRIEHPERERRCIGMPR